MKTKCIKIAIVAAALAMSPATAHAAGPPAGAVANGPMSLFYRMLWLLDFIGDQRPVHSCQHRDDCAG